MNFEPLSIRNQLLLLAALATGSIWGGAALQYRQLKTQTERLATVARQLGDSNELSAVARFAARERGLTNLWLKEESTPDLAVGLGETRAALDRALVALRGRRNDDRIVSVESAFADLESLRVHVDGRTIPSPIVFGLYSAMIATLQDDAARRLADGMIEVSLPYEHLNDLYRGAENLAKVRGLASGILASEQASSAERQALLRQIVLYRESVRRYERFAPEAALKASADEMHRPVVEETVDIAQRMVDADAPASSSLAPAAWWSKATEAVDILQHVSDDEAARMSEVAAMKMHAVEGRMRLTVLALVILGLVTLALVLATVGRVIRGLGLLLRGLDDVSTRRNLATRLDETQSNEFGTISKGVNRLVEMASLVVDEHERASMTDGLTQVMNRRGLDRQLASRLNPARAQIAPTCALLVDVDHFKKVNDTFGHGAGDQVLKGLARLLREHVRPDDIVARYGGEEFVVVLNGCDARHALTIADEIRAAVERHAFDIGSAVTISLGVAAHRAGMTPARLLEAADVALYRSKREGRNRVTLAPETSLSATVAPPSAIVA